MSRHNVSCLVGPVDSVGLVEACRDHAEENEEAVAQYRGIVRPDIRAQASFAHPDHEAVCGFCILFQTNELAWTRPAIRGRTKMPRPILNLCLGSIRGVPWSSSITPCNAC